MVFFPHKAKKTNPETVSDFLAYSDECVKQRDYLSAMFYCYWAMEVLTKAKFKKKQKDKQEELIDAFLERAKECRQMYPQNPIASTMKGFELDMMQRRIQEIKNQLEQVPTKPLASADEADKLAEKYKALAEEGVFLDGIFSPLDQEEGPDAWLERLGKSMEKLNQIPQKQKGKK